MYHIISGLKTYAVQGKPAFRMKWVFPTTISEVLRGIESIIAANVRSIHFIVASCSSGNRLAEGGLCKFGFRESDKIGGGRVLYHMSVNPTFKITTMQRSQQILKHCHGTRHRGMRHQGVSALQLTLQAASWPLKETCSVIKNDSCIYKSPQHLMCKLHTDSTQMLEKANEALRYTYHVCCWYPVHTALLSIRILLIMNTTMLGHADLAPKQAKNTSVGQRSCSGAAHERQPTRPTHVYTAISLSL
jgi:hypothetical protein